MIFLLKNSSMVSAGHLIFPSPSFPTCSPVVLSCISYRRRLLNCSPSSFSSSPHTQLLGAIAVGNDVDIVVWEPKWSLNSMIKIHPIYLKHLCLYRYQKLLHYCIFGKISKCYPKYWLAFTASVPPLGFSTYVVSLTKRAAATSVKQKSYKIQN